MPPLTPEQLDELVMMTNDASIVSKRSVERVYHPDRPQYLRHFVKKYQRRSPLVNRCYYLRMHLIDNMINGFLHERFKKAKVVVNLGCGSDTLPWRAMAQHPDLCKGVRFVDIDFPSLMARKCKTIAATPELRQPLTNLKLASDGAVILTSDEYVQIACDLRRLHDVDDALRQVIGDPAHCAFFFVAEDAMTYMDVASADALIHWAGSLGRADFCLLGQLAPDGLSHPFARSMTQHFDSMHTPIHALARYPTTADQAWRFYNQGWAEGDDQGWAEVYTWSLWEAWSWSNFMHPTARQALDQVEVFDDHDEFVHYASHHFFLHARSGPKMNDGPVTRRPEPLPARAASIPLVFDPIAATKSSPRRRFGAPLLLKDIFGQPYAANWFGVGSSSGRMRSCDLYDYSGTGGEDGVSLPVAHLLQGGPAARSCFTLTDVGDHGFLLAGGHASPDAPLRDCWLFKKDANQWTKTHDLPVPLYRHASVRLGASQLVLVAGGKTGPSAISAHYYLYHPGTGWTMCHVVNSYVQCYDVFGALLLCFDSGHSSGRFHGLLSGGMTSDGLVPEKAWEWELDVSRLNQPVLTFAPERSVWAASLLCRFGALSAQVADGWTVVAGGVTRSGIVPQDREMVRFRNYGQQDEEVECLDYAQKDTPRPVFVGASMISTGTTVAILGGGMGTVWSQGVYTLDVEGTHTHTPWRLVKTLTVTNEDPAPAPYDDSSHRLHAGRPSVTPIPHVTLDSAEHFAAVVARGTPVVFKGLQLGDCLDKWTLDYLAEQAGGADRTVVVHDAATQAMDFVGKNFSYSTQTFAAFIRNVQAGHKLYLRALSVDKPLDAPANLDADFAAIAPDFSLPPELAWAREKLFSSVLRISGPVNMWLHYDVLANVYCQIQGTKRFLLFPPSDVTRLGFAPGASSSSIDVFSAMDASDLSPDCRPHEAVLGPGDVLFLPQLWLHTATPVSPSSVAVNVFFRDLVTGYSAGRDVYGNRDLAAYEKARQDVAKMARSFRNLPRDTREFYLLRIADELRQAE